MQKNVASFSVIPAACGWCVAVAERGETLITQQAPTFAEAVASGFARAEDLRLPAKGKKGALVPVRVALAARFGVYERLTLPSTDPEELTGMVRLQFEKSLPYPLEETSFGFQILSQTQEPGVQTTVLACAVHHPAAADLCAPLLERRQYPQRLTLWAMHLAAQAPEGEVACGLWQEEEKVVFGIFEDRRLGFVEILTSSEKDVMDALPHALMNAEMAGAPVTFSTVLLDPSLAIMGPALGALLAAPVRKLDLSQAAEPLGETVDLTPEGWRAEQRRQVRSVQRRKQLALAGALYALLLVLGFIWVTIQGSRLDALKKQTTSMQPQVDSVIDRQARWKALAPAIERQRFTLEILFQTFQSMPTPETRITQFDLSRGQFMVEGEAPNAQAAIGFGETLKKRSELADYRIEAGQPVILPNEHAQFRIFGK